MTKKEFYDSLKDLGIDLSFEQKNQLDDFANLLIEYNEHTNITSITDIKDIYLKHFYDSLTLVKAVHLNKQFEVLDIGSGGGFPGIVLAIVFPNLNITLLDSNHKKTDFQNFVIEKLYLVNVSTVNERAENYFKLGKKYDLVVARAVANLSVLAELCIPFVKVNGYFVAMKGKAKEELEESRYAINFLGGSLEESYAFNLPITLDERMLIKVKKVKETKDGYPRVYDKIVKKPLKK